MKTYEDGLHEAWDLAQKVVLPSSIRKDAYTVADLEAIFEESDYYGVLQMPIDEVRRLLNAPKVGDVCEKVSGTKCVITRVSDNDFLNYLKSDGKACCEHINTFLKSGWRKTGENLSEVALILYKLEGKTSV